MGYSNSVKVSFFLLLFLFSVNFSAYCQVRKVEKYFQSRTTIPIIVEYTLNTKWLKGKLPDKTKHEPEMTEYIQFNFQTEEISIAGNYFSGVIKNTPPNTVEIIRFNGELSGDRKLLNYIAFSQIYKLDSKTSKYFQTANIVLENLPVTKTPTSYICNFKKEVSSVKNTYFKRFTIKSSSKRLEETTFNFLRVDENRLSSSRKAATITLILNEQQNKKVVIPITLQGDNEIFPLLFATLSKAKEPSFEIYDRTQKTNEKREQEAELKDLLREDFKKSAEIILEDLNNPYPTLMSIIGSSELTDISYYTSVTVIGPGGEKHFEEELDLSNKNPQEKKNFLAETNGKMHNNVVNAVYELK